MGVSLSKSLCGPFNRNCTGIQKFLPLTLSPLVFIARSHWLIFQELEPWPGVLVWGWNPCSQDIPPDFYLPYVGVGPAHPKFPHLCIRVSTPPTSPMDVIYFILFNLCVSGYEWIWVFHMGINYFGFFVNYLLISFACFFKLGHLYFFDLLGFYILGADKWQKYHYKSVRKKRFFIQWLVLFYCVLCIQNLNFLMLSNISIFNTLCSLWIIILIPVLKVICTLF